MINDGLKALKIFQANLDFFDRIITDKTMPQITGDKFAVDILQIKSNIPFILCIRFSKAITAKKGVFMGIQGFIMKLFLINNLGEKIDALLDRYVL